VSGSVANLVHHVPNLPLPEPRKAALEYATLMASLPNEDGFVTRLTDGRVLERLKATFAELDKWLGPIGMDAPSHTCAAARRWSSSGSSTTTSWDVIADEVDPHACMDNHPPRVPPVAACRRGLRSARPAQ
jgi:hypothetical protein